MECYPAHDSDSQAPDEFGMGSLFRITATNTGIKTNVHVNPLPGVW
jgi:hypothetical protein